MKKIYIDITNLEARPMSNELNFNVGDLIDHEIDCEVFGKYTEQKKVVKITENKYHKIIFYFVENVCKEEEYINLN